MEGIFATYLIYPRDFVFEARFELLNMLNNLSTKFPELKDAERYLIVNPEGYKGILIVDLRDVLKDVEKERKEKMAREILLEFEKNKEEGMIKYLQKLLILDAIVNTDIEEISKAVERLKDKVKGKWRITLKTRKWPIDRMQLIRKAAEPIEMPVDLENPEYEVIIQIFGKLTGIAIIKRKSEEASSHHL